MSPTVRIIIVNYNGGAYLGRCLAALFRQTLTAFEAVLVDNGSTDGSLDGLPRDTRLTILPMGANLGFAAGNNRGAEGATTRWLAMLNPDAFPEPEWLERLVAAAEAAPSHRLYGSTQLVADAPERYDGTGDFLSVLGLAWRGNHRHAVAGPHPGGECFAPCAAAALYERALFEAVGGFDERFFCYNEDVDLAFRMRRQGATSLQVGDAVVHHVGSGLTGRGSDFAFYHGYRNQVWTLAKNLPWPILWLLPLHLGVVLGIILLRPKRARVLGRALRDALAGLGPYLRERGNDRVSWTRLAAAITWNPLVTLRRGADLRPPRS